METRDHLPDSGRACFGMQSDDRLPAAHAGQPPAAAGSFAQPEGSPLLLQSHGRGALTRSAPGTERVRHSASRAASGPIRANVNARIPR